jgi:hypothetical protein
VQQVLVLALGSIMRGAPLVAGLFYVVLLMWIGECSTPALLTLVQ